MALASYPRSGNSLLRALLEAASGVLTGSDTPPAAPLLDALVARDASLKSALAAPAVLGEALTPRHAVAALRMLEAYDLLLSEAVIDALLERQRRVAVRQRQRSSVEGEASRCAAAIASSAPALSLSAASSPITCSSTTSTLEA